MIEMKLRNVVIAAALLAASNAQAECNFKNQNWDYLPEPKMQHLCAIITDNISSDELWLFNNAIAAAEQRKLVYALATKNILSPLVDKALINYLVGECYSLAGLPAQRACVQDLTKEIK